MENEKRLIDATAYCKELYLERDYPGRTQEFMDAIDVAIADLCDMSTVDAVEVVHGRWSGWHNSHCSICECFCTLAYIKDYPNYCPNCGAKMDLEDE